MPLTHELGAFASGLSFAKLPAEAVEIARTGFIDTIATMIAGARRRAAAPEKGVGPAPGGTRDPVFHRRTAPAPEAAWINGTAGHALDYDDVGGARPCLDRAGAGDPRRGRDAGYGGDEMIVAYVAGYETWAELARRDPGHHHARAGTRPAFSARSPRPPPAPGCAGSIRAGDDGVALSASQAGHHGQFRHDDKAVPCRPRGACRAGLGPVSAELGFTAASDALEHPQGFLSAVSPEGSADRDSPTRPGGEWQIVKQGLSIKKYPACYCTPPGARRDARPAREATPKDGRDRAHHRLDQQDAFLDPAQPRAANRFGGEIQHGVRDGGFGHLAPRQPRRATPTPLSAAPRCRS